MATICSVIYGNHRGNREKKGRKNNFIDHLLMGRSLTLPFFVATLVATWYGGILGVTRIAFEKGIFNFITQGAFWYISYIIFALFLVKKIAPFKAVTLPDLIHKMFGANSAKLSAVFNFFNVLPIAYAISLGLFLQMILGGELWVMMVLGVSLVVLYSCYGGFRSVVFSDIIQFFVMCSAVLIVLFLSITEFGGINFLQEKLPASYFSPVGDVGFATTIVWGFIALSTLVDPNFYQRCFAARSGDTAKIGILLSTIIWVIFDICTTFGAMYAKANIPDADASYGYLIYAIQILPPGLRGFFLAGILATILSTLDSYLFLAGTTLTFDLAPKKYKNSLVLQRLGVVLVGILAIIMGVIFEGNIKSVWKTLGSYSAACLLLPVMYGHIFPNKIKDNQFVFACILGAIGTTGWRMTTHTGFAQNIDELYIGIFFTTFGLLSWQAVRTAR